MSDIQKRIDEFFESMDHDEFVNLLQQAGFTVSKGDGCVLFTEEESLFAELSPERILEQAKKSGIKYTPNSKNPGIFVREGNKRRKIRLREVLFID